MLLSGSSVRFQADRPFWLSRTGSQVRLRGTLPKRPQTPQPQDRSAAVRVGLTVDSAAGLLWRVPVQSSPAGRKRVAPGWVFAFHSFLKKSFCFCAVHFSRVIALFHSTVMIDIIVHAHSHDETEKRTHEAGMEPTDAWLPRWRCSVRCVKDREPSSDSLSMPSRTSGEGAGSAPR